MPITRYTKAPPIVKSYFNQLQQTVFTFEDIEHIFQNHIGKWILSVSTTESFAKQLVQSGILLTNEFRFGERTKPKVRFWKSMDDIYDVALSLVPNAYLSHVSALFLHGIIGIEPKQIYITSEQSKKEHKTDTNDLEQETINNAFSKPQRQTNSKCKYLGKTFFLLNGMFTERLGVITIGNKPITSIERTLLDMAVRPAYAGGAQEVLKAFINARNTVDIEVLINLLDSLNYTYPYYQSIGFYLEKAGYSDQQISKLKNRGKYIDFYLDYAIENPIYSKNWRLFYSQTLEKISRHKLQE